MLARVVEVTVKGGKKPEILNILQNELLPLLQKQPGFVGFETLARETDPNTSVSVTFWQNKDYAETCYAMPAYAQLLSRIRPLITTDIKPVFHNVEISTAHRIPSGKAA
jgi:quinol monooxygenase YgiN